MVGLRIVPVGLDRVAMTVGPNAHLAGQRGINMRRTPKEPPLGLHRLSRRPERCGKCNAVPPTVQIGDGYAKCLCGWDGWW